MIAASEHVMPEARVEDWYCWDTSLPKYEYVAIQDYGPVKRRLHWQPSTALQAVGTGRLVSKSFWYFQFWPPLWNLAHLTSDRAYQSARIGFGAK